MSRKRRPEAPDWIICGQCLRRGRRAGHLRFRDRAGVWQQTPELCFGCMDAALTEREQARATDPTLITVFRVEGTGE